MSWAGHDRRQRLAVRPGGMIKSMAKVLPAAVLPAAGRARVASQLARGPLFQQTPTMRSTTMRSTTTRSIAILLPWAASRHRGPA
jgi:hypothetical protein